MALLDRTLVQIRERSFPELLDLAVVVARSRAATLGAAALAGIAPFAALNAWLAGPPVFAGGWVLPLMLVEAPLATAPLTVALGMMMFGERPTARKVARVLWRTAWQGFFYLAIIRGVLLATLMLSPLVPSRLAFLPEVVLLERGRFFKVVPRTALLCANRGGDLFGQAMASLFLGAIFVACAWTGTGAIWNALVDSDLTWDRPAWADLVSVRFQVAAWAAIAFFAVVRFLAYIDTRIRLEGWEVEQQIKAVAAAMEGDRTW